MHVKLNSLSLGIVFCLLLPLTTLEGANPLTVLTTPKEKREISSFKDITILGKGTLYISQGKHESLMIEADEEMTTRVTSYVENQHLFLGLKDITFPTTSPINYYLTVKDIQHINARGDINLITRNTLNLPELAITLTGDGVGNIKIKGNKLHIKIIGNSELKVQGSLQEQTIQIKGNGQFMGKNLSTRQSVVNIEGNGIAEVKTDQNLTVDIKGSGKVKYYGNPVITQQISGNGEIIPL